jgi:glycosyltransferase involved in cell wall biosynthesis
MYSERLIEEHGLQKYRNKICVVHRHFIDFGTFKITKSLKERNSYVGYIGALSKSKGVPNFLEAIPIASKKKHTLRFIIGGSGQLQDEIKEYLDNHGLNRTVKFFGWIPHGEIPDYMNRLKLLVLPSYTEGLPNIVLEAMACGTPVLTTAVGAIPDVIKDGETGFIMENNSPDCIARNVVGALNHPNLGKIAGKARALVEQEYTYEVAVKEYRNILASLK